jgi:hypothetical protein
VVKRQLQQRDGQAALEQGDLVGRKVSAMTWAMTALTEGVISEA